MKKLILFIFTIISSFSFADNKAFRAKFPTFKLDIYSFEQNLHPCQFQVGELVIQNKISTLKKLKRKGFQEYLKSKVIPVIIGPDQKYWMIDRHHTSLALIKYRQERSLDGFKVNFEVREDWSNLAFDQFFKRMLDSKYIYSKRNGGDIDPSELPGNLDQLSDDPFRSLSWLLREAGAYSKVSVPFLEFFWGDFLRKILVLNDNIINKKVVKKAIKLIFKDQHELANFPGFISFKFKSEKEEKKTLKKMIKKIKSLFQD